MLFCPSFTQSERFHHTDQLITRLQVAVMTNFIRMLSGNVIVHVFKSDATCRVRRLAPLRFTSPRAAELSVHSTIVPGEQLHILLHWFLGAIPSQAPPTSAISSDSPQLRKTMFCFLEDACTGYHVFSTEPLTQTAIPEQLHRSPLRPNLAECPQFQEHQDCNQRSCCMQDFQSNISANA